MTKNYKHNIFSCHSNLKVSPLGSLLKQQIIFKTLVLIYIKYLTTGKPKYFAPYLSLYTSAVKTRRSDPEKMFLKVPFRVLQFINLKVHFNKCFSYDAPKLWNDLPLEIRSAPSLSCFKRRHKTYLFQKSFHPYVFLLPNTDDPLVMTSLCFTTSD